MKCVKLFTIICIFSAFLMVAEVIQLQAISKNNKSSIRFHSGYVLCAEIRPDDTNNPVIINVSKHAPPLRISGDLAYAAVTVMLDKDRSLGIYDYVLKYDNFNYTCVALRTGDGPFDADKWEITSLDSRGPVTMLFRVQLPPFKKKLEYSLHFILKGKQIPDILLKFRDIGKEQFTAPSKIPTKGLM